MIPVPEFPQGQRNNAMMTYAMTLLAYGTPFAEIEASVRRVNAERCAPPLGDAELRAILRYVERKIERPLTEHGRVVLRDVAKHGSIGTNVMGYTDYLMAGTLARDGLVTIGPNPREEPGNPNAFIITDAGLALLKRLGYLIAPRQGGVMPNDPHLPNIEWRLDGTVFQWRMLGDTQWATSGIAFRPTPERVALWAELVGAPNAQRQLVELREIATAAKYGGPLPDIMRALVQGDEMLGEVVSALREIKAPLGDGFAGAVRAVDAERQSAVAVARAVRRAVEACGVDVTNDAELPGAIQRLNEQRITANNQHEEQRRRADRLVGERNLFYGAVLDALQQTGGHAALPGDKDKVEALGARLRELLQQRNDARAAQDGWRESWHMMRDAVSAFLTGEGVIHETSPEALRDALAQLAPLRGASWMRQYQAEHERLLLANDRITTAITALGHDPRVFDWMASVECVCAAAERAEPFIRRIEDVCYTGTLKHALSDTAALVESTVRSVDQAIIILGGDPAAMTLAERGASLVRNVSEWRSERDAAMNRMLAAFNVVFDKESWLVRTAHDLVVMQAERLDEQLQRFEERHHIVRKASASLVDRLDRAVAEAEAWFADYHLMNSIKRRLGA